MKKKVLVFISFIMMFFILIPTGVSAKKEIASSDATHWEHGVVGTIKFYDDFTIRYEYKHEVKNILITVCPKDDCVASTTQEYEPGQTYFGSEYVDIFLKEHFTLNDNEEYIVSSTADFQPYPEAQNELVTGYMSDDCVFYEGSSSESQEDEDPNFIMDETNKFVRLAKKYLIPGLYALLGIVLVIKGILLAIDLAKHADEPDIRKEKIRAFAYFGIAILALIGLNTFAGFYTGLFG
jgi:hypothetical protein